MATAEEVETQRFYLRKIEGAEILLAYETNFFRQALHAYSQVAPTAPPILETSKSTRKPRPTKLQKLMAQHGVDDPENLPQNLRTKPHTFKRKSSEPSAGRPHPLQPAPGRSDSGTPTSNTFPPNASMHHNGPTLSGLPPGHDHAHPTHFSGFPGGPEPHFTMSPQANTSPAFAPHAFLHGGLQSPGFSSSSRQPGIFNEAAYGRIDSVALPGSDSPMRDAYGGSSQGVARMFDELTNQDGDDGPKGERRTSPSLKRDQEETKWEQDEDMNLFFDGP